MGPRVVPHTRLEQKEIQIIAAIDIPPLQPFHQFYKGVNRQHETHPALFQTHITCSKASQTYCREIHPTSETCVVILPSLPQEIVAKKCVQ